MAELLAYGAIGLVPALVSVGFCWGFYFFFFNAGANRSGGYGRETLSQRLQRSGWGKLALAVATCAVLGFLAPLMILPLLAAIHFGRNALLARTHAQAVADTPTALIRSASQGRVELMGRLPQAAASPAPVSGRTVAFWMVEVHHQSERGQTSLVGRAWSTPDFLEVEDQPGSCLLAVPEARFKLSPPCWETLETTEAVLTPEFLDLFPPPLRPLVAAEGKKIIHEVTLPVGAEVYAFGFFQSFSGQTTPFEHGPLGVKTQRTGQQADTDIPVFVNWLRLRWAAGLHWQDRLSEAAMDAIPDLLRQWGQTHARLKEAWTARRQAQAAAAFAVHTLREDVRSDQTFPLIVSDVREQGVVDKLHGKAMADGLIALVILGVAVYYVPNLYCAFFIPAHWVIGCSG